MRPAKPVLFAVILSFLPPATAQSLHARRRGVSETLEPSDRLSGLATFISLQDSAQGRFATLKISVVAHAGDTSVSVHEFDQTRKTLKGAPLATLDLKKGEARSFIVRVAVARNQESHFYYKVNGRAADGSITELMLYGRIPADDADPCEAVDDYIQCPGQTVQAVEP